MDTVFLLIKNSNIMWEYGHNQLPETLQPYIKKIRKQFETRKEER